MRRIVLLVALLLPVRAAPAAAHACANPVEIPPGQSATVTVGVGAEEAPIVAVDVTIPEGFRFERVVDARGWTSTREGARVRFTDGRIPVFGCAYFALAGTAPSKGLLVFPLSARTATGEVREFTSRTPGDPSAAQLVYVGITPGADATGDNGTNSLPVAGIVLLGVGGLAAGVWLVRDRMSRTSRRRVPARPQKRRR